MTLEYIYYCADFPEFVSGGGVATLPGRDAGLHVGVVHPVGQHQRLKSASWYKFSKVSAIVCLPYKATMEL